MRPNKLTENDEIRVIAPSRSLAIISQATRDIANKRWQSLGLTISFSKHCEVIDEFSSSSIEQRVEDLHDAFLDKNVKAIFTVIGGYNVNQLLSYIDYSIIKANPKIICGYSDTIALSNAIYAKTGLITYSGPAYSTLGMRKGIEYSLDYLKTCLFDDANYDVVNPLTWSDDAWFIDQENRTFYNDLGIKAINAGKAEGTLIGGNLCTLNLLQGTEFMPSLKGVVLFIEDNEMTFPEEFDRDLQSLLHQKDFSEVKAIVIGKFQVKSKMNDEILRKIINSKQALNTIPILSNVSFGHTTPHITFPIGGTVSIDTESDITITILDH